MRMHIPAAGLLAFLWAVPLPSQTAVIRSLVFEGNRAVDTGTLKSRLRVCREGSAYQPAICLLELVQIEGYYRDEGYLQARVGPPDVRSDSLPGGGTGAAIRIPVSEGPRFALGSLDVRGAQVLDAATLLGMSPLRTGDPYSRRRLHDWIARVEDGYRSLGYMRFRAELKEEIRDVRRVVDCVLECREGSAFQVGKISIIGLPAAEQAPFRRRLLLGEGGSFNPEMIPLSVHFINTLGIYRQMSMSDVDLQIDEAGARVNITVRVELARKASSGTQAGPRPPGFALQFAGARLQAQDPQATIRTEVALVNVIFAALDRNSRPVSKLRAEDFQVFEDRQPQKIEFFSALDKGAQIPLTIAFLIDTSGSVRSKLSYEKETAAEFFRTTLRPNRDLALIMQFDSEVNLVHDFTDDAERLVRALDGLEAGNSTALFDAIYLAVEEKLRHETGRKIILVITDGDDTSSKITKQKAIEVAQRNDIQIYGIGVKSEYRADFGVLKKFAEDTGGLFFSPRAKFAEVQDAFRRIGEDLQGQYSLAYTPTNRKRDGTFRAIDVRSGAEGIRIRTRKGYYAPKDQ